MTRTIDERIDAVVADLFFEETITALVIATTLKKHFAEPWLDKPNGPGWWWVREANFTTAVVITSVVQLTRLPRPFTKWQRVIGPQ